MPSQSPTVSIPAARRFICALALLPIVPAASVVGMMAAQSNGLLPLNLPPLAAPLDELGLFQLLFSTMWVAATILVWRSLVLWTLGRKWLTALVSLIPFVQVVWAKPLWTMPGCRFIADELLMVGQHQVSAGLWVWMVIWIWWGLERRASVKGNSRDRMVVWSSRFLVLRLIASLGTIPVVFGIFMIAWVFFDDYTSLVSENAPVAGMWVAAMISIVLWISIWAGAVRWSPRVRSLTVLASLVLLALPLGILSKQAAAASQAGGLAEVTIWCMPVIGWGVWMAWTIGTWPIKPVGRNADDGPKCLRCGYALRGLRATRCPECGDEPTLDELWGGPA